MTAHPSPSPQWGRMASCAAVANRRPPASKAVIPPAPTHPACHAGFLVAWDGRSPPLRRPRLQCYPSARTPCRYTACPRALPLPACPRALPLPPQAMTSHPSPSPPVGQDGILRGGCQPPPSRIQSRNPPAPTHPACHAGLPRGMRRPQPAAAPPTPAMLPECPHALPLHRVPTRLAITCVPPRPAVTAQAMTAHPSPSPQWGRMASARRLPTAAIPHPSRNPPAPTHPACHAGLPRGIGRPQPPLRRPRLQCYPSARTPCRYTACPRACRHPRAALRGGCQPPPSRIQSRNPPAPTHPACHAGLPRGMGRPQPAAAPPTPAMLPECPHALPLHACPRALPLPACSSRALP